MQMSLRIHGTLCLHSDDDDIRVYSITVAHMLIPYLKKVPLIWLSFRKRVNFSVNEDNLFTKCPNPQLHY